RQLHPVVESAPLQVVADPLSVDNACEEMHLLVGGGPTNQVRCPAGRPCSPRGIYLNELEALGDNTAIPTPVRAAMDDCVLQVHKDAGRGGEVVVVDEDSPLAQKAVVALDGEVDRAVQQRVARRDVLGEGAPFDGDQSLLEGDPLVAAEQGRSQADLA